MIGTLYVITNKVNGKMYVGKTYDTMKNRFKAHIQTSKRDYASNRPLYKAFAKYSIDNFRIDSLGKFKEGILEQEEIKAIERIGTFRKGYNLTIGGDGNPYLGLKDIDVVNKYKELGKVTFTAKYFDCCVDTISNILRINNISVKKVWEKVRVPVILVEKNLHFISQREAAAYLINNKYTKSTNVDSVASGISKVLIGFRKTSNGFHWK